jgi:hypothetical protein
MLPLLHLQAPPNALCVMHTTELSAHPHLGEDGQGLVQQHLRHIQLRIQACVAAAAAAAADTHGQE